MEDGTTGNDSTTESGQLARTISWIAGDVVWLYIKKRGVIIQWLAGGNIHSNVGNTRTGWKWH